MSACLLLQNPEMFTLTLHLELLFSCLFQLHSRSVARSLQCHNGSEEAPTDLDHLEEEGWTLMPLTERVDPRSWLVSMLGHSADRSYSSLVIQTYWTRTYRA